MILRGLAKRVNAANTLMHCNGAYSAMNKQFPLLMT